MFAWYQTAKVCFAYLADVQRIRWDKYRHCYVNISGMQSFEDSRWWQRGWTLQELLAPVEVIFLSRDWGRIGTKKDLADLIEGTTSIPQSYLLFPERIEEASVAERLSWASNRQTSRAEDMAYCLMGLFGINMPLLYGEGGKAFTRLQHEILRSKYDHTLLAWGLYSSTAMRFRHRTGDFLEAPPLFAPSPSAFDKWTSRTKSSVQGGHYFLTNLGLHIDLPLILLHDEHLKSPPRQENVQSTPQLGLALLDCYHQFLENKYRVALPLQLEDRGGSGATPLARRAQAANPFLVPESVGSSAKRVTLYLQNGQKLKSPQFDAKWCIGCHALYSRGYYLADYFPPTRVENIYFQQEKTTALCIAVEPSARFTLVRLRHEKYATVILLIEHPVISQEDLEVSTTTLRMLHEGSKRPNKRRRVSYSTSTATGGIGQLWISSTDNLKTAFEMVLQPAWEKIGIDYLLEEFDWTHLGNIASGVSNASPKDLTSSQSTLGSYHSNRKKVEEEVTASMTSSFAAVSWRIEGENEQVKEIEPDVLEKIGVLTVVDPTFFSEHSEVFSLLDDSVVSLARKDATTLR